MAKTKYLESKCLDCNQLLHASRASTQAVRDERDAEKKFCGNPCRIRYQSKRPERMAIFNKFLYGVSK